MIKNKKIKFLAIFSLLLFFMSEAGFAEMVDKVAAVVNDEVITISEIEREEKQFARQITNSTPPEQVAAALEKMREGILQQIIEDRLIRQHAKKSGVSISADEFNQAYQKMLKKNGLTKEQFAAKLKADGISPAFHRKMFRGQMLQSKLISYQVRSRVVVTDDMIDDYYRLETIGGNAGSGFHLLQIGIGWEDGKKSEALALIEEVRKKALNHKNFSELAKEFSTMPSAKNGGDLGVLGTDEMSDEMRETIMAARDGISEIIETDAGFQFFKVSEVEEGQAAEITPHGEEREKIRKLLYDRQFKAEYSKWVNQLKEKAYIEIL